MTDSPAALIREPFSQEAFDAALAELTEQFPDLRARAAPWRQPEEFNDYYPMKSYGMRLLSWFNHSDQTSPVSFFHSVDAACLRQDIRRDMSYAPFAPEQASKFVAIVLNRGRGFRYELGNPGSMGRLIQFQREYLFRQAPAMEIPTPAELARCQQFQVKFAEQGIWPAPHVIWLMTKFIPEGFITPKDYVDLFATNDELKRTAEAYAMGVTSFDEVRTYDSLPAFLLEAMKEEPVARIASDQSKVSEWTRV